MTDGEPTLEPVGVIPRPLAVGETTPARTKTRTRPAADLAAETVAKKAISLGIAPQRRETAVVVTAARRVTLPAIARNRERRAEAAEEPATNVAKKATARPIVPKVEAKRRRVASSAAGTTWPGIARSPIPAVTAAPRGT